MPPESLPGAVFQARPAGKRPRGRPRTRWGDRISALARGTPWDPLMSELLDVALKVEVWGPVLELLPPRNRPRISGWRWDKTSMHDQAIYFTSCWSPAILLCKCIPHISLTSRRGNVFWWLTPNVDKIFFSLVCLSTYFHIFFLSPLLSIGMHIIWVLNICSL